MRKSRRSAALPRTRFSPWKSLETEHRCGAPVLVSQVCSLTAFSLSCRVLAAAICAHGGLACALGIKGMQKYTLPVLGQVCQLSRPSTLVRPGLSDDFPCLHEGLAAGQEVLTFWGSPHEHLHAACENNVCRHPNKALTSQHVSTGPATTC